MSAPLLYPYASATGSLWHQGFEDGEFQMADGEDAHRSGIPTTPMYPDDGGQAFGDGQAFYTDEDHRGVQSGFEVLLSARWVAPDEFGALDHLDAADDFGVVRPVPEPTSVLMGGIAALLLTRRPCKRTV